MINNLEYLNFYILINNFKELKMILAIYNTNKIFVIK